MPVTASDRLRGMHLPAHFDEPRLDVLHDMIGAHPSGC